MAIRYGASALGLVSAMPSGPGVIPESLIREIARTIPPGVASFLLTSKQDAESIITQQRQSGVDTLQLCDSVGHDVYERLSDALPGIRIVQVIHVRGEQSISEAETVARYVHAILLDSGNPALPVKTLGGTGKAHDWGISRRIRDAVGVPIFLAGGLNATNVAEAVSTVQPYALDVCSGVRTNGRLDERKLQEFFEAARSAEGGF